MRPLLAALLLFLFFRAPSSTQAYSVRVQADVSDFSVYSTGISGGSEDLYDLVVGDTGGISADLGRRFLVKFPLSSIPAAFQKVALRMTILQSRRDQYPDPGIIDNTPPFTNPGLGDLRVIHVDDYGDPDPADYFSPSVGNDPAILVAAGFEPPSEVRIDVTPAVEQALSSGRQFVAFRMQMELETDGDGLNDFFAFASANHPDPAVRPVLEIPVSTQPGAVVALHLRTRVQKSVNVCPSGPAPEDPNTSGIPCRDYAVSGNLFTPYTAYLVVARADFGPGLAGVSCGLGYDPVPGSGIDVFGWTLCADLDFPNLNWPESGGGNRITWAPSSNCQRTVVGGDGVHAIAGAFYTYAYSDDVVSVTRNLGLVIPEFAVADCSGAESPLSLTDAAGKAGFGTEPGFNPCASSPVAVERTSWGAIKSRRTGP